MRTKVIRLKLTCQECHKVGYIEFNKHDLKGLRAFLKNAPPGTKAKDWTRVDIVTP